MGSPMTTTTTDETTTANRVARAVRNSGEAGMTWIEVAGTLAMHHGPVSGALSRLESEGVISRLVEQRSGNSVYVMPEYRRGRQRATSRRRPLDDFLEEMLTSYDDDGHCVAL